MSSDPTGLRVDPVTGAVVQIVPGRQNRPNLPKDQCPFCIGGIESPDPYVVRAFENRWPSFPDGRCEVVLYGPEHGTSLARLGAERAERVVDLWAERTEAHGARPQIDYVLVFENHGAAVGATIDHPHGQIFGFDRVPPVPATVLRSLEHGASLLEDIDDLVVFERDGWRAWVPQAAVFPHQVRLAPLERRPDLPSLARGERRSLSRALTRLLTCVEQLFDETPPYMFWWVQRPSDGSAWDRAWLHLELACPWRGLGLPRHVAAGELGGGVLINPVDPLDAANRLRSQL